jgi:hypothetical protein
VQGFDQHKVGERTGVAHETVCRRLARLLGELRRSLKQRKVTHAPPAVHLAAVQPVLDAPESDDAGLLRDAASSSAHGASQGSAPTPDTPELAGAGPGGLPRPQR